MRRSDIYNWVWLSIVGLLLGFWAFTQIRYLIRRYRRNCWPTTEAVIQKGAFGKIPMGKGATVPANFVGYSYTIEGVRRAGFFALIGNETQMKSVESSLVGASMQIRYNPSDPDVSLLADYQDPRFGGMKATQSPEMLDNAPSFNLQDAIRGAGTRGKGGVG